MIIRAVWTFVVSLLVAASAVAQIPTRVMPVRVITFPGGANLPLSPAWALPDDPPLPKRRDPWLRRLVWITALAAGLAVVTFVGGQVMLGSGNSTVQSAADQLR